MTNGRPRSKRQSPRKTSPRQADSLSKPPEPEITSAQIASSSPPPPRIAEPVTLVLPDGLLEDIRIAFQAGRYRLRDHAFDRMGERSVAPSEVRHVVLTGQPIEYDSPGSARPEGVLFNGNTTGGRALHVKVGLQAQIVRGVRHYVVTVYEPDPKLFSDNFSIRITRKKGQDA